MSTRGAMKRSHLRQVSAASLETLSSSKSADASQHSNSTHNIQSPVEERFAPLSSAGMERRQCVLWVHDETFSRDEFLFNQAAFSDTGVKTGDIIEILPVRSSSAEAAHSDVGSRPLRDMHVDSSSALHSDTASKFKTPLQTRCLFMAKPLPQEIKSRNPKLELSVTSSIANTFGLKNRSQVFISIIDRAQCGASHVDISFRDQFLVRSDMWRLVMSELADKVIYKGQKISFMGSIKATVKNIFIRGKKVLSGYFSPHTIPVFRSEAAKYVLFIQMSREMWDFDSEGTGDILFSRVINGFLPELFKRWANSDSRHLVTIVLFTRVEYDVSAAGVPSTLNAENLRNITGPNNTRDFYRVVVNDMASGHWTTILDELKRNFRTFLRDVSILKPEDLKTPTMNDAETSQNKHQAIIAGRPSTSLRGNILEAIHLASAHLSYDYIDRDMIHTGTSIIVITPGSGVFEVSFESLASTTEALTSRGIAIDLVCLSPMPLHSVPLFKYKEPAPRPSSSTVGDINAGGYSPETRHSFVNFANRSPNFSPRAHFQSSFSGMIAGDGASHSNQEWNYGIPHWLDISYWNPDTYRESRRILKKDPNAPIPFTVTKRSKVFVPRVRMYEIQMMGVMESEQSNISIPYLLEGQDVSRARASTVSPAIAGLAGPRASKDSSSYRNQLSDSFRPEPLLQNMKNTKAENPDGSKKKKKKSVLSWMDNYDDVVFEPSPKQGRARKSSKPRKRLSEPEVQGSGMHERLSARSVTRLREHEIQSSERDNYSNSIPRRIEPTSLTMTSVSPVFSKTTSPQKPALKPPSIAKSSRISRNISFALRGLGANPPRAQASTEVNVEHANALPMFNQKQPATPSVSSKNADSQSISDTASSSASTVTAPRSDSPQKQTQKSIQKNPITPSKPISIKVPPKKPSGDGDQTGRSDSFTSHVTEIPLYGSRREAHSRRSGPRFEVTVPSGSRELHGRSPAGKALAPWVRSINPCNAPRKVLRDTSWFGRWQHAYPRPPHIAVVKWKSLKCPAVLPLTTEEFPSLSELGSEYLQTPYRVFPNDDAEGIDAPRTRGVLLREMISLRLSHGFQIVVGNNVAEVSGQYGLESLNVFDTGILERDGTTLFMCKGSTIHRLICVDGGEIEVTRFTHQNSLGATHRRKRNSIPYSPAIRTIMSPAYEIKDVELGSTGEEYNYNYADNYIAGHRDHLFNPAQQLQFWRVRYVLIPMRLHVNSRRHLQAFNEDNEEEIHLLGISQLTHIWRRHKYIPPEEKRFESSNKKRDQNPLNIMYQTRNPSEVVAAELDRILLTDPRLDNPPAQLLPESELLERSNISLTSLAQVIQGDKGVRMMDRRWHWRLHYNCFIGFEFTTWLLQNFRDIDSREEAVEFGNELMQHGLFQHVEKRHNFRDGNYFYQISSEYRASRPESRGTWFPQIRPDRSVPSTPATDQPKGSPASGHARVDSIEEQTSPQPPNTPAKAKNKVAIMLSKSMKYDVDPRKRSSRTEVVDLHYDRLHNPENCFHIELNWMNTTPKLIEDTVMSWASTADKFGLRLVQVPIAEAASISSTQPFRTPYRIKLKVPPPTTPPAPAPPPSLATMFNSSTAKTSFAQQQQQSSDTPDPLYFQKAILRKHDFVLDFEATTAFPADVEVSYSWGIPDYQYSQYIHRSGSLLAQLTETGDYLILANRLASTRGVGTSNTTKTASTTRPGAATSTSTNSSGVGGGGADHPATSDRPSPRLSPLVRPALDTIPLSPQPQPQPQTQPHFQNIQQAHQQHQPTDSVNLYRAPEHVLSIFEDFCSDAAKLEAFYAAETEKKAQVQQTQTQSQSQSQSQSQPQPQPQNHPLPHHQYQYQNRPLSTGVSPAVMDSSIPSLELPASVVSHHISSQHAPTSTPTPLSRGVSDGDVRDKLKASSGASSVAGAGAGGSGSTGGDGDGGGSSAAGASAGSRPRTNSRNYKDSPRSGGLRPLGLL